MKTTDEQHNLTHSSSPAGRRGYEKPLLTPSGRMAEVTQKSDLVPDGMSGLRGNHSGR